MQSKGDGKEGLGTATVILCGLVVLLVEAVAASKEFSDV